MEWYEPKDPLRVGQKLVIWKDSDKGSVIRTVFYNVRSGDTISGIASKFKVKTNDIVKWNSLHKKKNTYNQVKSLSCTLT